ncbi:MAG: octanoyltransferase [Gammaproteobacteria bacterium RIFCSPHIGHO2_12_FULL_40_19]|nr:MAG: octanoyltransferase [Gammaproteobacteria bacterium RIFCSPHIGHO2_12_FULL_40_19]
MQNTENDLIIRDLGMIDYLKTWENMRDFTDSRTENTVDEIWVLQHPPVFTQGLAGKPEHILNPHHIPVIQTDRGGQVTYHGPGQLIVYVLIDLKRKHLHARELVQKLEKSVIELLSELSINASTQCNAPGVYVHDEKICSIGLRIRKGSSYHGIALNVDMDLTPFHYINPCGYQGMKMTQIKTRNPTASFDSIKKAIVPAIMKNFGYNRPNSVSVSYQCE